MKCKKPIRLGLVEAGCAQCLPCRINRQRQITIRGLLEAGQHAHSTYATFTYDRRHLPSDGSLSLSHVQLLFKRLRHHVGPFRYLVCGEYGGGWRPHYHAILYGVREGHGVCDAWSKGYVHISGVGPESIGYVAGYCLKGATNESGMRWHGKSLRPEFVRWSRVPPIGASAADLIGRFYTGDGKHVLELNGDVSSVVRQGQKFWPIGRYLKERVRSVAGIVPELRKRSSSLLRAEQLKAMSSEELNSYLDLATGRSEASGFRAEAKYKRMSLEKKL